MIRRPPRSTLSSSSAASDVYKRQVSTQSTGTLHPFAMSQAGMRLSLLLALFSGALGNIACPGLPNASYAELANGLVPSVYTSTVAQLSNLTDRMQPADKIVHSYRKELLALKNYLEVFAGAYPLSGGEPKDRLKTLEGQADAGYEKIGDFQDLAHSKVNYTKADVDKLRGVVTDWKKGWQTDLASFDYGTYVASATEGTTTSRKHLSKFFWSKHSFQPNPDVDAQANLELLLSQQLEAMADLYRTVSAFPSIVATDKHTLFHNVRKYARAINFMTKTFDCILVAGPTTDNATALLGDLYDKYGAVNDMWTAYNYEVTHNHTAKAAEEKKVLEQGWADLKTWQTSNDFFDRAIVQLRTHIRSSTADIWHGLPATCTWSSSTETHCSVSPYDLKPTQFEVGLAEVLGSKVKFFANKSLGEVVGYLSKKVIPVIVGNHGRSLYQIDGHHTTYAMHWWKANVVMKMPESVQRTQLLSLPLVANIKCNWTSKFESESEFWAGMQKSNFVLLEKSGQPMTATQLPATIDKLTDNPLRSLAGIAEIVTSPCIAKTCVPFAEFVWSDFLRSQISAGKMPQWQSLQSLGLSQNYTAVAEYVATSEFQAVARGAAAAAAHLPGVLSAGEPAPAPPDCPWDPTGCN
eukprot:TRINITY_DN8174_c0_g4_i1.p1 TRINITY_DN8174_c0_g4~~TRINITY_DN8174_c0_g4_i1.p1  ORF type:complete len:636 (+),score=131.56 TRINITY_DN8174_c0_g4_i1:97-2004(+)